MVEQLMYIRAVDPGSKMHLQSVSGPRFESLLNASIYVLLLNQHPPILERPGVIVPRLYLCFKKPSCLRSGTFAVFPTGTDETSIPIVAKCASCVAHTLLTIFTQQVPPKILQSDAGSKLAQSAIDHHGNCMYRADAEINLIITNIKLL